MPSSSGSEHAHFASDIAVITQLQTLAERHPDLPSLVTLTLTEDGVTTTPWLMCRPITALLMWVKALPGKVAVRPVEEHGATRLDAVARVGGVDVTFRVTTHLTDIETGPAGLISRTKLAQLAAGETAPPNLDEILDIETIQAPNAPMPDLVVSAPQTSPE